MNTLEIPSLSDIEAADRRIRPEALYTPLLACSLDGIAAPVLLKCESLQPIGAFKIRGALNAVRLLSPAERSRGVVTHSSGNHAQALAYAAKTAGIRAYIVMPHNSPQVKVEGVKRLGGTIFLCQPTEEARVSTCAQVQRETGATVIHPFDNAQIIAGQGTVGLEILAQHPSVSRILVPLGGGGLLGGIAIGVKARAPHVQVIGVEPEGAAEACAALTHGRVTPLAGGAHSIAEGLLTTIGERNFQIVRSNVDRIITVSDQEIAAATKQIVTRARLVVEPSGATAVAALQKYPELASDTVCVVSGGNVDFNRLIKIISE